MTTFGSILADLIKKTYKLSGVKTDFNYPVHIYPKTSFSNKYLRFLQGLFTSRIVIETSERIVENSFVLTNLRLRKGAKILEVGCSRSTISLELASLGYKVTGVDLKPYGFSHPNLALIQGDLRYLDLPYNYFDGATAISTIEHTGMGAYKEKKSTRGDIAMLKTIYNLLKREGRLFITLPFGKSETNEHERVYDNKRLRKLFAKYKILKTEYYKGLGREYWVPTSYKAIENVSSVERGYTQGVVCIVASKK